MTQSDILVKSYFRLNFLRASVFNFERLDMLRDSIGYPSLKLLWFAFSKTFHFPLRVSWYITGLRVKIYCHVNILRASVFNFERLNILRDSIRHLVKSYCRLNLLRVSVFNFVHLDILHDSIKHPSQKLLSFEFAQSSVFNFERLDILRDSVRHLSKKLLSFDFCEGYFIQFRA